MNESWESSKIKKEVFKNVIVDLTKELGINDWVASPAALMPAVPPQLLPQPRVDLSLLKQVCSSKNIFDLQAYVNTTLHENYGYYVHLFTDGSKNPENGKSSCAFYIPELKMNVFKRFTDHLLCKYAAEMMAVLLALPWIQRESNP